ncbi:hypothetical protein [Amycolatopsis sp. NPDC003731]
MRSQDIAALIQAGTAPAPGDQDISLHKGTVRSWDRQSGVNTVEVNGTVLNNLDSLQGGVPTAYAVGDVVLVARKQSTYFLLGKVASAAGLAGSAPAFQTSGSAATYNASTAGYGDLASGTTPAVSTYIGSNRTALVLWQAKIDATDATADVAWQVSGASSIAPGQFTGMGITSGVRFFNAGTTTVTTFETVSGSYLIGPGAGLNPGFNTFSMKVRANVFNSGSVAISALGITVIPL